LISNTVFLLNHLEKRSRPDLANHAHWCLTRSE
jgi:hypothetical protein